MNRILIKINKDNKEVENLPFSGTNGQEEVSINNQYFEKNKRPWFPIMGEFHFSRCNEDEWPREIAKMKAGGVDIVASYVIWIHHEEIKDEWDFSGQRNLRKFIQLCQEAGLYFFLRIGPWAHGEVRNGGIPDWVQHGGFELRSNNKEYLTHVKNYFEKVYQEVEGLFYKDGGPIIGLQIENEYGHAGGFSGEKGIAHMKKLKELLVEIGFDTPFYTATAWGGGISVDGDTLPVFGGYVDAPWSYSLEALPANSNFIFSPVFDDPLIASDFKKEGAKFESYSFDIEKYPYLTAELGGGLQVTQLRRPLVSAKDTEVQALVKLGSGANLLGYYMYHGGTNPQGKLTTLEETRASGSHTDVPKMSYDFQAPLGEYGIVHESFGTLRKLHLFVKSFQEILTKSQVQFAKQPVVDPENTEDVRYSIRFDYDSQSGFIFVNNYQRLRKMTDKKLQFEVELENGTINFPSLELQDGEIAILPFNLKIGEYHLKSSNATLLTVIDDHWIFVHPRPEDAKFIFSNQTPQVHVLSDDEANNAYLLNKELYLSKADLWEENNQLLVSSREQKVKVRKLLAEGTETIDFAADNSKVTYKPLSKKEEEASYSIDINYDLSTDSMDLLLDIDFIGDRAELFDENGTLVADWFTTGKEWAVSLKTLAYPKELKLIVFPTETERYLEVDLEEGCELRDINLIPLFKRSFSLGM